MNKRIIVAQRPQIMSDRVHSNQASKMPISREKDINRPDTWQHMHQSGVFPGRNRIDIQNKPVQHYPRFMSTQLGQSAQRHSKQSDVDLVCLVTQLAKMTTETQQRLTDISTRINRLEHSLGQFKAIYKGEVEGMIDKSLELLYQTINKDFKTSEDSIIKHVHDIRDQVRSMTSGKLHELQMSNQKRQSSVISSLQNQLKKQIERTRQNLQTFKKKMQTQLNEVSLEDCILSKIKAEKTKLIRFSCTAKLTDSHQTSLQQYCYYITQDGYLTDEKGYLLMDLKGQRIMLANQHIKKLKEAGLLQ